MFMHSSMNLEFRLGGIESIVEIDEAKFGRRKYHRGRRVEGVWVFGAVQRSSENTPRRACLQVVSNCSRETLLEIIFRWIIPG